MAKMTLEDLRTLREEKRTAMEMRDTNNKTTQVVVSMGTTGIAAGAKEVLEAFSTGLTARDLTSVSLQQTASLGLNQAEPTVEVRVPGMPDILYGKVTVAVAELIIEKHIIGKELVKEHVYDKPAKDMAI